MPGDEITTAMLLQHMQSMEQRLLTRFARLDEKIDHVDEKLTGRINRLEANLTRQIDSIDKRLDAIEIEQMPKRLARVEEHLQLQPL